jgi:hypothetical protein
LAENAQILSTLRKLFFFTFLLISSLSFCQIKLFFDTTKLINGNGVASLRSTTGKNFGFQTYRDGHLNGDYYHIDTAEEYSLKGELRYKPTCLNYSPGVEVRFRSNDNDTLTMLIDSSLFKELFEYSMDKIIETQYALVPEPVSYPHPDLNIGFSDDPAVVPVGRWQRLDLKRNYVFEQFDFDDCGNTLLITYFNPDGSILNKQIFRSKGNEKKNWYPK